MVSQLNPEQLRITKLLLMLNATKPNFSFSYMVTGVREKHSFEQQYICTSDPEEKLFLLLQPQESPHFYCHPIESHTLGLSLLLI